MIRTAGLAAMLGALLAGAADPAAAQTSDVHCAPAIFTDKVGVARVAKARARVNFIRGGLESKACPNLSEACRSSAYLVAGDVVLTSERRGEVVCATFANSKGVDTAGWLPAAALEPVPHAEAPVPSGWVGTWRRIDAQIVIKAASGGALGVGGTATWGANDPGRVERGTVRSGEISGAAKPVGDTLFISDAPADTFENAPSTDCAVRMRRIAHYLLVEDNNACGGMNVSFSGIYVRQ